MSNQPAQSRQWFRLPSLARPAAESIPTPAAAAPEPPAPVQAQPRPVLARPSFRPVTQPTVPTPQPQETTPAPPPTTATAIPSVTAPPPVQTSPAKPGGGGVGSVPSSPVQRAPAPTASLPSSPIQTTTATAPVTTTGSVQSSPRPRVPAPTSSVPTSPVLRPARTFSLSTSPETKPVPTTMSVPTSPTPKQAPTTTLVTTSPTPKPAPTTTTTSVTTSPTPKRAPKTTSVTTSPAIKTVPTTTARGPSPVSYPKTINPVVQSPPRSPKPNPNAPPPSPLILPPAKLKSDAEAEPKIPLVAEQKTVLVQKTVDKPKPWISSGNSERDLVDAVRSSIGQRGKQENLKDHHGETKEKLHQKKLFSDSEDGGMRVITIAGENKGAIMEVIRSPNKKHVFEGNARHLRDNSEPKSDGNKWKSYSSGSSSSDEQEKPRMKDRSQNGKGMNSLPMSAFMNSNVQSVNNSIVYNSSCSHHDPGVHLALSRKPAGGGFQVKDRSNGHYD